MSARGHDAGAQDCLRELAGRCDAVPGALRALLGGASNPCADPALAPELAAASRWVVVGIGASEWPARLLASRLRARAGCAARFVPLSAFADARSTPSGDVLVVVSQGLSPNARLALRARERFTHGVLLTGQAPRDSELAVRGFHLCAHGPDDEAGLLLRVVGPPLATLAALRLAERVAQYRGFDEDPALARSALFESAPDAFARALASARDDSDGTGERLARAALEGPLALITAGDGSAELAHGLRWKLLEGLGVGAPVWDVLGFAHGPFQRFVREPLTLVALDVRGGLFAPLFARLGRLLDPALHRLVVLTPRALDGLAGFLEHDALFDGVVLRALAHAPRDLRDWPGKGLDGPLYDLGCDAEGRLSFVYAALRFLAYFVGATLVAALVHRAVWHGLLRPLAGDRASRQRAAALALGAVCALLPAGMLQLLYMREAPRWLASPLMALSFGLVGVLLVLLPALALSHALGLALGARANPARRASLRRLAALASGVVTLALSGTGIATAASAPATRRLRATLPRWPASRAGYRVVQLSDLHVGPTLGAAFVRDLVERANAQRADLVVITGDLVDGSVRELGPLLEPLRALRARDGVYFVTGNHEYLSGAAEWVAFVRSLGITVLRNERVTLGQGEGAFDLAGTDDDEGGAWLPDHGPDLERALAGRDATRAVLLLAHRPGTIEQSAPRGVDLQLSGHTHGGQLRPLDLLEGRYAYGAFVRDQSALYVTSGAGYWGPPMRLGTRSELPVFELFRGEGPPRIEPV